MRHGDFVVKNDVFHARNDTAFFTQKTAFFHTKNSTYENGILVVHFVFNNEYSSENRKHFDALRVDYKIIGKQ